MVERLLSQLAHVEILSPKPQETVDFLTRVLGLQETERRGSSAYLRGWSEFFHHSLQVTEAKGTGLGHVAWRAEGPQQLEKAVARLQAGGQGIGWDENPVGHGPAYRYRPPHGGQLMEVFWEVERVSPPDRSTFPNRPQRRPMHPIAPRYLDHVTMPTPDIMGDVLWYRDTLGHRFSEWTSASRDSDLCVFAMMTLCERAHDMGLLPEPTDLRGRVHHVAFWLDQREDLRTAADVLLENGGHIEFGPGRHGMGEIDYVYFREPAGLRLELNSGTTRNYEPDLEPIKWTLEQGSNVFFRNIEAPPSPYLRDAFPPAEVAEAAPA
jgi:catechol 2,3-dioxygenase